MTLNMSSRVTQDITDGSLPTKRAQPDPRNRATSPISTATTVAMRFGTIGDMIDEAIEHEGKPFLEQWIEAFLTDLALNLWI